MAGTGFGSVLGVFAYWSHQAVPVTEHTGGAAAGLLATGPRWPSWHVCGYRSSPAAATSCPHRRALAVTETCTRMHLHARGLPARDAGHIQRVAAPTRTTSAVRTAARVIAVAAGTPRNRLSAGRCRWASSRATHAP